MRHRRHHRHHRPHLRHLPAAPTHSIGHLPCLREASQRRWCSEVLLVLPTHRDHQTSHQLYASVRGISMQTYAAAQGCAARGASRWAGTG